MESLDYGEKRLHVKNFLDDNFKKGTIKNTNQEVVVSLEKNKTMTDKQLFYYLQSKFKDILPEDERDDFLKDVIKKWYYKKISKNGSSLNI